MKRMVSPTGHALNIFSSHNRRGTSSIRTTPTKDEGKQFYVAEGKWDIAGLNESGPQLQDGKEGQYFPMVAGEGFEPPTFGL
jgi:hypothetical protein